MRVAIDPVGQVFVYGALWRAELADWRARRSQPALECESKSVDGLTLKVRTVPKSPKHHVERAG